jgi:DNA-binding response OmpR family regulator
MGNRTVGSGTGSRLRASREMRDNAKVSGDSAPERWWFEGFTLDLASRTLSDDSGEEVPLWRSEFALLAAFVRAPGRALSRGAPGRPAGGRW